MRVSIVTISYNQAVYIEQTIRSVIEQSYDDIEYIVVDAGSTDGSRDIIQRYRDKISRIVFEPDEGPADGLNKGFGHATGNILAFVNADDLLLPSAVQIAVKVFERSRSIDVVYGNAYVLDAKNRIVRRVRADPFNLRRFLHGCVTFVQPSMYFRRDAYFSVRGFNTENRTCWDGEFLAELGKTGNRIVRVNDYLSCFRIHDASISGTGRIQQRFHSDWERMFNKIRGRPRRWYDTLFQLEARVEKWTLNPVGLVVHTYDKLYPQTVRKSSSDLFRIYEGRAPQTMERL